ncbi:MAG: MFS transporter [Thermoplasmataceae archaeon]
MEYKWVVLSNTTLGVLMSSLDSNIVLIALPDIGRSMQGMTTLDLLWVLLGYQLVVACVLVNFGRLSDMFGRVRLYNMGFALFTVGSGLCSISQTPEELIGFRVVQAIGSGFLFSNSAAIITDAFPTEQRGMALGVNQVSIVVGSVSGLILGGVLSQTLGWQSIFWVNLPIGTFATIWAHLKLRELSNPSHTHNLDISGNLTFAGGVFLLLIGLTLYAIAGLSLLFTTLILAFSAILLAAFVYIDSHRKDPMFDLTLFRNHEFTSGNETIFLNALARGSFILVMVFYLQGPIMGMGAEQAGIFLIPMSVSLSIMGPISGILSDRFGQRMFVVGGLLLSSIGFLLMTRIGYGLTLTQVLLPLVLIGAGMGMFASPNRSSIMNSVPGHRRGVASGISTTLTNVGGTVSIGLAFILMSATTTRSTLDSIFSGFSAKVSVFDARSFIYSVHTVFYISTVMLIVSIFLYLHGLGKKIPPVQNNSSAKNAGD